MRVSELLGLGVHTESGRSFGHVHDLRAELTPGSLRVTGICVGKLGLLERLGFGAPRHDERLRSHDVIEWADVVRADRRGVVVRDGARPG